MKQKKLFKDEEQGTPGDEVAEGASSDAIDRSPDDEGSSSLPGGDPADLDGSGGNGAAPNGEADGDFDDTEAGDETGEEEDEPEGEPEDKVEDEEQDEQETDEEWALAAAKRASSAGGIASRRAGNPSVPAPRRAIFAGAVLGGAIGDAMGHPTEFISSFSAIRSKYGPRGVTGYELYWDRGGKRFAPYTDDTQMAEVVLRTLLNAREQGSDIDETMREMAQGFIQWADHPQGGHRAPGGACMSGCRALARGVHWSKAGGATAGGCGSVMRAYPFGLLFADDLARAERWSVAHSKLTHRDPIALAACAAMAVGMARIVRGDPVLTVASEMVGAACRYSPPTAAMIARALEEARTGVKPEVTLNRLRAWAAHEAIAAAVYLFVRHPDDPAAAILEGANTPGDSDSIATLAGAMLGARCGLDALPSEWVRDVERSDELLDLALRAAAPPADRG
ncbi:MAG TPA: ADP-ribosylglycohydrolase family protein [Polyangiaceae bacterium]|nr:ADP-ribosylglycohydrolase family protein [Polyangiaceae bacterium]